MLKEIKDFVIRVTTSRFFILSVVFLVLFSVLIHRLFVLQIVDGKEHLENFEYKSLKDLDIKSTRGNIYDKNGKLLAYNRLAYQVVYDSSTSFRNRVIEKYGTLSANEMTEKINYETNLTFYNLIKMLEKNGDQIISDFPIIIGNDGKLQFSTDSTSTIKRFKYQVFGIDATKDPSEYKDYEKAQMDFDAEQVFEYLRHGTGSSSKKFKKYDISDEYSTEDALKIMTIRYNISLNAYSQYKTTAIASDISEESVAKIKENPDVYYGIDVEADSLRQYNDSKYFAHIIGYTGKISEEQVDELNEGKAEDDKTRYDSNDIVGKAGIEATMEEYLQGVKGHREVFVNNLGQILEETSRTEPEAGNDVYLSIDADLQKYSYDTLEQNIANILVEHLTTGTSTGTTKNRLVPIYQAYFALIDNNVVDHNHFSAKDATSTEQGIYNKMVSYRPTLISNLQSKLHNSTTPSNSLSDEDKEYMSFIYDLLINDKVLIKSNIDSSDSVASAYADGKISLGEFLNYAIQKSWIDVSKLDISSDFYDLDTIYNELINYIGTKLEDNTDFEKLIYKYLIKNGTISGREVCLTLYDQGVLNKKKDDDYEKLKNGYMSSYTFMYNKIKNLEITPAQLALDPYSGTVIITDVDTGKVLTAVSYPSYDNNKMANHVDSSYFQKINTDKSSPMLFRATQSRSAPGSTFKPLMAIAGLEEGVISDGTAIFCNRVFDKIVPSPTCLGYHGNEVVRTAIRDSCNVFFYEIGYRLGLVNGRYSSETGLEKIKKYAHMFGLDETSGIELNEYSPQVSTEDAVRSSIGQGTNNYTPSQIARYVTTIANRGTTYNLSLLDKVKNQDGKTIKKFKPDVLHKLDVKESTWNAVADGMYLVVNGGHSASLTANFKNAKLDVSGKTGTAQEDKRRADHALFMSYSPSKDPEISVTVVVQNGYTSANAAKIASDIYKYYFKTDTVDNVE